MVEQALKVWTPYKHVYGPEIARTTFLKAKIFRMSRDDKEADFLFTQAAGSRKAITKVTNLNDKNLTEAHFDELVAFWSR